MTKIKNDNLKLSKYVLNYLISNDIIKSGSTLENLHLNLTDKSMLNYESAEKYKKTHKHNYTTGINEVQKYLYNLDKDEKWYGMYLELLKTLYEELGYDFYFQKTPTVRVHCPNAKGSEHYPMYHSDIILGHPPQEINVWLSLTDNKNTGFFILDYDDSILGIFSKKVLNKIKKGDKSWIKDVPKGVDKIIKSKKLFGYK